MFVAREILHRMGLPIIGCKVAVQGMGNVGGTAARLLYREGCIVQAVSDVSGGVYDKDGLKIDEISDFLKNNKGSFLKDYNAPGVKHITNDEVLTADVDMLIPAALENQITEEIAQKIKALVIVEGANGPTTVGADKILERNGKNVVPDILANAGGVVVSYFEWVQNIQSLMWDEHEVNSALEKIMIRAFNEVWDKASANETTMRMSAYMDALDRIVKAKKIRGIFP
jgi:glutamate dehydrogenase/leucine dehydrogenase